MASPLAALNQANYLSGGVSYRPPTRIAPAARRRPRGLPVRTPGTIADKFRNAPDIMSDPEFDGPERKAGGLGGVPGLGYVIGKAAQAAGMGLSAIDYPRAAVVAGLGELVDVALPALNEPLGALPFVEAQPYDEEAIDRSFDWGDLWNNMRRHSSFREQLVEPIMGEEGTDRPGWLKATTGFVGDVAADPLTYLIAGTGANMGKKARGEYLGKLLDAQQATAREAAAAQGTKAATEAWLQSAPPTMGYGALVTPEMRTAMAAPILRRAEQRGATAAARQAELGGTEALELIGRRGVNVATPPQLQAMGIGPHALRWGGPQGFAIPGTQGLSAGISRALGPAKETVARLPGMERIGNLRTPQGFMRQDLREAMNRMVRGTGGAIPIEQAIRTLNINELGRGASGTFTGLASAEVNRLSRELDDYSPAQIDEMRRAAELDPTVENALTRTGPAMLEAAREAGGELPEIQGARYVIPHVLSRDAFNFLKRIKRGDNPLVDAFRSQADIQNKDLLEDTGFVLQRKFRPNPDGTPQAFKINVGKGDAKRTYEFTIETNSLDEVEEKVGGILRDAGFQGKLYETDPREAWRKYVRAVRTDVGKRAAVRQGVERGFPGLVRDPGRPGQWDPYGGRRAMTPDEAGKPRELAVAATQPRPPDTDIYRMVPADRATRARNKRLGAKRGMQAKLVQELEFAADAGRVEQAATIDKVTNEIWADIVGAREELHKAGRAAGQRAQAAGLKWAKLGKSVEAINKTITDNETRLRQLRNQIAELERATERSITRREKAVLAALRREWGEALELRQSYIDAYENAIVNSAAREERLVREAGDRYNKAITDKQTELEDRALTTELEYREAHRNAVDAVRQRWGRRYIEERAARNAERAVQPGSPEHQAYLQLADRREAMRNELSRAQDAMTRAQRSIDTIDERLKNRNEMNRKGLREQKEVIKQEWRAARASVEDMTTRLNNFEATLQRSGFARAQATLKRYADQQRQIANWPKSMKLGPSDAPTVGVRKQRAIEAAREWDVWRKGIDAENQLRNPLTRPTTMLDEAEQTQLNKARKLLRNKNSKEVIARQGEAANLAPERIGATARERGVDPRSLVQPPQRMTVAQWRAAKARRTELLQWLDENEALVRRVNAAQDVVRRLEVEDARRLAAPVEGVARHPFMEQAAQQHQLDVDVAKNVGRQTANIQEAFAPKIQELTGRTRAAREAILEGAETGFPGIQLPETAEMMSTRAAIEREAAVHAYDIADNQAALESVQTSRNAVTNEYRQALQDREAARAAHEEIMSKVPGRRRPESAMRRVEESTKGAAPTQTELARVAEGRITPYEAQPLKRNVDDTQKLIDANPNGNDELMTRSEAALQVVEQELMKVGRMDLTARQARDIVRDARAGKLAPVLKGQLRDSWRPVWEGGDILIAKDLERMYFNVAETLDSKFFGRLFTMFTDFFKTYATLSPGFHVRNALSAIFMNASEGVAPRRQIEAMRWWRRFQQSDDPVGWFRKLAKDQPQVADAFRAVFASGSGGQFYEAGVSGTLRGGGRAREKVFSNWLTKGSQRIGQNWVEGPSRLALALDSTRSGQTALQALQRVTRIHFDYSEVSKFDEQAKRIIPFWTFMSRNVPLQFTQIWRRPRAYNHYASFMRNFEGEAPEMTPEYITQQGGFQFLNATTPSWLPGAAEGMPLFLQPDLPHTRLQADLQRVAGAFSGEGVGQLFSEVNPLLTAPFELGLRQDFYTGQRFEPTDVAKAQGLGVPLAMLMSIPGMAQHGEGGWFMDKSALNVLQGLNPLLGRQIRLAPGTITTEPGPEDRQFESWARFGTGAPIRTISNQQLRNEARNRAFTERERRQLEAILAGG